MSAVSSHVAKVATTLALGLLPWLSYSASGADWPTFRHDQRRSGSTTESINACNLSPAWRWHSPLPPSPAWPDGARWDAYAKLDGLRSMRDYDPVFYPVVVGNQLLFASNADDSLHCLSLQDGSQTWILTAGAPIRVAPVVFEQRIYFGADDGCVYAVSLGNGELLWRRELSEPATGFINDGRLCSFYPIRTGLLVDDRHPGLLVGCGLFPWNSTSFFKLDLQTGDVLWEQDLGQGWTIEGPMLLAAEHIIAPQGRAAPQLFSRTDGKSQGALSGGGGSFTLLTDDDQILHGPGNKSGWISVSSPDSKQKLANFDGGISAVVAGSTAFVLDPNGLNAIDRNNEGLMWKTKLTHAHEVILARDTLFVGTDDHVAALNAADGQLLWGNRVDGRAIGLAVANGHLVVSTDNGEISVFATTEQGNSSVVTAELIEALGYEQTVLPREKPANGSANTPLVSNDPALLERWLFHNNQVIASSDGNAMLKSLAAQGHSASLPTDAQFLETGGEHYWMLEGEQDSDIAADFRDVRFPAQDISVVATVRVDRSQPWGGLLSMSQDNGSYEKGWILGFQKSQFGFAVNGMQGKDALTWTLSKNEFKPRQWYHVVGTYDGMKTKLYINGELAAESNEQQGAIQYPDAAAFHMAAYKDRDEHFFTTGRLNEIALYQKALTVDEVRSCFNERERVMPGLLTAASQQPARDEEQRPYRVKTAGALPLDKGPEFQFTQPGTAVVEWKTPEPMLGELKITSGSAKARNLGTSEQQSLEHRWEISGMAAREMIRFRVQGRAAGDSGEAWLVSQEFECDGHFNYSRPLLTADDDSKTGQTGADDKLLTSDLHALLAVGRPLADRGLALVVGAEGEARLAETLATDFGFDVWQLAGEADAVATTRSALLGRGLYGRPVSVRGLNSIGQIPNGVANLLVLSPDVDIDAFPGETRSSLINKLQPRATLIAPVGMISPADAVAHGLSELTLDNEYRLGDTVMEAFSVPKREGSAGWTHMYGLPDNTAFAGETLSGASSVEELKVAWAGRPGPRYQSDRGNRKPSPLASNGRLFLQGLHRLIGLDAHNGTILWSWEFPQLVRFNVPRDCSNWCADESRVFVAIGPRCKVLDGATGVNLVEHEVWNPTDRDLNWGFVARTGDLLLGSGVDQDAAFTEFWGSEFWYDAKDGELAKKVCSDSLFALNADTGQLAWTYAGGLVVNPTIAITAGKMIFVECRSATLQSQPARRLDGPELWDNLQVVCLDVKSGEKLWEVPARPMPGVSAVYGVCSPDHYLLQTSDAGNFALYALSLKDGSMGWRGKYAWEADHHGKHLSRPAILGDKIFLRPLTLELATGNVLADKFPAGHQCGTYTASSNALFLRAGSLTMWDGKSQAASRWDRLRPDCWISTIPAEGMVLSPEGGGGCSCGGWLESSIGFTSQR